MNSIIFILLLILVAFFRPYHIIPDTISYYRATISFLKGEISGYDVLHNFLLRIFAFDSFDPELSTRLIFFAYCSLSLLFLYLAFRKLPSSFASLTIYSLTSFVYLNLVQIRWGLAVAVSLFLVLCPTEFGILLTILFLLISHSGSLILLPPFLFSRLLSNISSRTMFVLFIVFSILSLLLVRSDLALSLSLYLSSVCLNHNYLYWIKHSFTSNVHSLRIHFSILSLSSTFTLVLSKVKSQSLPSVAHRLSTALYILILEYVLFFFIPIFSRRILSSMVVFSIPLLTCIISKSKNSTFYFSLLLLFAAAVFSRLYIFSGLIRL